jgi:hypothetical protein
MKSRKLGLAVLALGAFVSGLLLSSSPALAVVAGELQDFEVIGHHFTTSISTAFRNLGIKDPSKGRYIVLKLAGRPAGGTSSLFANDFVLVYSHKDGSEDRASADAIGEADTPEPGEFKMFYAGDVSRIQVKGGSRFYFGLVFYIEPDVESIDIHRLGSRPLRYRVGSDRKYSVFVTTNTGPRVLSGAKELLDQGGYHVTQLSEGLARGTSGTTIHYAKRAESQAREISQRLMAKLNVVPTLKEMELISEQDIVVWFGK